MAELIVAIGVLALMLTLAGEVMSLTVRSTGQAKALTDVNQQLRILERTLREDLKYVQPGNSLILIQGNPVNSYWTEEGRDADDDGDPSNGYPHARDPEREDAAGNLVRPRADILMVFSGRRARSSAYADVTSEVQQVVYGHAELGEYIPNAGGGYEFAEGPVAFPLEANVTGPSVDPDIVSLVPAARWHLARRSVLLIPTAPPTDPAPDPPWASLLDDDAVIDGITDVVGDFDYDAMVLTPPTTGGPGAFPFFFPEVFEGWAVPFARSRFDPTPPALVANRLGHYFLPNCASFMVEWALDPRSGFVGDRLDGEKEVFWLDPGDVDNPLASLLEAHEAAWATPDPDDLDQKERLRQLIDDPLGGREINDAYSLAVRFGGDDDWVAHEYGDGERPNLAVFGAQRRYSSGELAPDEIFPSALRITVDVYDDADRLERPVRHVMVIPVGR